MSRKTSSEKVFFFLGTKSIAIKNENFEFMDTPFCRCLICKFWSERFGSMFIISSLLSDEGEMNREWIWHHVRRQRPFFFLGSRLLVQSGANSTGSSPKQGSLVPGVPGEVGGGGDMVVKGRTWQDECIQSGVTRPTAAWTSSRANPAEPGRSLRPSPGRAPPGCDEEDTACPGVRKGTPCGDRGVVQHRLNKICFIINLWK